MHRIDTPTAQKDKFGAGKNGFTRGNPQTGTPATDLDDDYFDMLQEELAGVVEAAGIALNKSTRNQLLAAIRGIIQGGIASASEITNGTAKKLVDAAGLKAFLPKRTFATNDFVRIPDQPGGLIIQWGMVIKSTPEGVQNVIFPTPFPNFSLFAIPVPMNTGGSASIDLFGQIGSMSNSDVNFFFSWATSSSPADGFRWFAIGF